MRPPYKASIATALAFRPNPLQTPRRDGPAAHCVRNDHRSNIDPRILENPKPQRPGTVSRVLIKCGSVGSPGP